MAPTVKTPIGDAVDRHYIECPDMVAYLVGGFCAKIEAIAVAVGSGLDKAEVKGQVKGEITRLAGIFSGIEAAYSPISSYNESSLGGKLIADLAPFWRVHRAAWADDPRCVLFDWLASLVMEKVKLSDGDDMLLEIMLKPSVQYAVQVLLAHGVKRKIA